jgi:ferrous iron transport protein B
MTEKHEVIAPLPAAAAPSCHGGSTGPAAPAGASVIALVGSPNSGKSTLFNGLSGGGRIVGNWPGTTVEVGTGAWRIDDEDVELLDLPGAYSLDPHSPDEELTRSVVLGEFTTKPEVVVVVADAAHLARSLYLVAQLRESATRVVVALTMVDVADRRGITVDAARLSEVLGVPAVSLDPRRRAGLLDLHDAVSRSRALPTPLARTTDLVAHDDELAVADERFAWIDAAVTAAVTQSDVRTPLSDRIDRWTTGRITGPIIFLGAMWAVFQATTTIAVPIQDALGSLFAGPVTSAAGWFFGQVGLGGSWLEMFVTDGLIAGVGMLLTFVPLMTIMFALLALLEDSGYMARAAVVTDRTMRAIGLPGKAFLPLVVGFGCNVPAISATRILPDARHRLLTALLVPFTSCSARLTVYVLVASTFFRSMAGTVVFGMYLVSILVIVVVGLALKSTLWRTMGQAPLMLDLPPYQRPTLRVTSAVTWMRVKGFLSTAGGIIVATVTGVWLVQAIPLTGTATFGHVPPDQSLFAGLARLIAPIFGPLGFGDWHTASALVVGFIAKEAVVTSWAQTYAAGDPTSGQSPIQLQQHIDAAFHASSAGATLPAVLAFLVFLLAYTPCVATLAAQLREIGARWTVFGIAMQLTVAWVLAFAVFQVGSLLV